MAQIPLEIIADASKALQDVRKFSRDSARSLNRVEKSATDVTGAFRNLKTVAGAAVAVFAGAKLAQGIRAVVDASAVQEAAVNQLNTALQLSGDYSAEASASMQKFASDLQAVSTVGDETTLEMLALAKTFGTTNEGAQDLVQAAADLSAATGMELSSAVRNLGKSYSGLAGELGESIPALRELTQEQLKAGGAIDLVLKRFGGSARAKVNTFSGAVKQLSNTWGDLLEEIGNYVTKNPAVITAIKGVSTILKSFGKFLSDNRVALTDLFLVMLTGATRVLPIFTQAFGKISEVVLGATSTFLRGVAALAKWSGATEIANSATSAAESIESAFYLVDTAVETVTDSTAQLATDLNNIDSRQLVQVVEDVAKARVAAEETIQRAISGDPNSPDFVGPTQRTASGDEKAPNFVGPTKEVFKEQQELNDEANKKARLEMIKGGAQAGAEFIDAVAQGEAGAKKAVVAAMATGISTILDAVLPGIGQALGPFINSFLNFAAQGPEVIKEQIKAFVEAIPAVVDAIAEALPIIAEVLARDADKIILGLARGILIAIRNLILNLDVILYELVESVAQVFTTTLQDIVDGIFDIPYYFDNDKLNKILGNIGASISDGFKDGILGLGDTLAEEFKKAVGDLNPFKNVGKGNGKGGVAGAVGKAVNEAGKFFGLASGGLVPHGFPNDTFPAALSSGEMVIPRDDVVSLRQFLNRQQTGTDANTNVLVQILAALQKPQNAEATVTLNQREFAKIILELNRNNRRIA
jgi:hypothetical protein